MAQTRLSIYLLFTLWIVENSPGCLVIVAITVNFDRFINSIAHLFELIIFRDENHQQNNRWLLLCINICTQFNVKLAKQKTFCNNKLYAHQRTQMLFVRRRICYDEIENFK